MELKYGTVKLEEYSKNWKEMYNAERENLKKIYR